MGQMTQPTVSKCWRK